MNKRHANLYDMYIRVVKVLNVHINIWQNNNNLMANFTMLTQQVENINRLESKRDINKTGISQQKTVVKDKLIGLLVRIIKGLRSFAADHNHIALAANVDYTKSDLLRIRENLLTGVCERVYTEAQPHLAQLGDYGITAELLNELQNMGNEFKKIQPDAQLMIGDGKASTEMLNNLFTETTKLLNERIDGKIEQFKEEKPEFYYAYTNARNIIGRSNSIKTEVISQ